MSIKEFNQRISDIKSDMGFYKCHVFDREDNAKNHAIKQKEEKNQKKKRRVSDL